MAPIKLKRYSDWTIGQKISFAILATTLMALSIAMSAVAVNDISLFEKQHRAKLVTLGGAIAETLQAAVTFNDNDSAEDLLTALRTEKTMVLAAIYKQDRLFGSYISNEYPGASAPRWPEKTAPDFFKKGGFYHVYLPILLKGQIIGTLYLKSDTREISALYRYYAVLALAIVFFATVAAFVIAYILRQKISAPIVELASLAGRISNTRDFSVRAQKTTNDEIGVLINSFNDMLSEIQKNQKELTQNNEELAQFNRELGEFAYIASHDLQEPLRKIITFSERISDDASNLKPMQRDFLERMNAAGKRMRAVIEDLLQYSRISRGEMDFEHVDLQQVLEEVLFDLEMLISESKATIHQKNLPTLRGNRAQMRHLFQNLISNAIKFRKKGQNPELEISGSQEKGMVELRFKDNGIGFNEKYLTKIFKPFQRLHGKEEYEGTGIGLSIVQKIIHNHQGSITAQSAEGQGATFIVRLPLDQQENAWTKTA